MCTVYILRSQRTGRYYVGQTQDLTKHLAEHNSELAGHTRKEQPWLLVWHHRVGNRKEAMILERKIKKRGASRFLSDQGIGGPVSVTPAA